MTDDLRRREFLRRSSLAGAIASGLVPAQGGPPTLSFASANDLGLFNVKDPTYGARGNGSDDDTAAIRAAVKAAAAARGTVFVPSGSYVISSTITDDAGPFAMLTAGPDQTHFRWNGPQGGTVFAFASDRGSIRGGFQITPHTAQANGSFTGIAHTGARWLVENAFIVEPRIGVSITSNYGHIYVGLQVYRAHERGIVLIAAANSNLFYCKEVSGVRAAGSEGLRIEGSNNVFHGSELTGFEINCRNVSGILSEIHGFFIERPTAVNVQVDSGTLVVDTIENDFRTVIREGAMLLAPGGRLAAGVNAQRNHLAPLRGLTAYYPMQDGAGDALSDFSGAGRVASIVGGGWVPGPFGTAVSLPTGASIVLPTSTIRHDHPWTIAALIKHVSFGTVRNELLSLSDSDGNSIELQAPTSASVVQLRRNGVFAGNLGNHLVAAGDRAWVCVAYDGSTMYNVNGIVVPTSAVNSHPLANPFTSPLESIHIGDAFSGAMIVEHVGIWDRVCTWDEMLEFQSLGSPLHVPASAPPYGGISATASSGGASLPERPEGFKVEHLPGIGAVKIPFYRI